MTTPDPSSPRPPGPPEPTPARPINRRRWLPTALGAAAVCGLIGLFVADATLRPVGPHRPPPAGAEQGRWVFLEGAANTRDAGGYRTADGATVRRGRVYRSATLAGLSADGVAAFRRLGVKTVLDFRNRVTPWPPFNGDPWSVYLASSVHGCPMSFARCESPRETYIRGVRDNAASFREAFELLSRAEHYPVLYHCTAGKDRAGVMSALLLALLGVDRDTIMSDFRLSEQVGLPGSLEAMNALLDEVASRGGIRAYLQEIGVSPEIQDRVRAVLLEP